MTEGGWGSTGDAVEVSAGSCTCGAGTCSFVSASALASFALLASSSRPTFSVVSFCDARAAGGQGVGPSHQRGVGIRFRTERFIRKRTHEKK